MGCGCGKKSSVPVRPTLRPSIGPLSIQGGSAAIPNPAQVRALSLTQNVTPTETHRMDEQRQKLEKMRREAIKRRLNK
jgi:hypothetical protein